MSAFEQLWKKLARNKRYREEFVAAQVKRGIPFQIRALMKTLGLSQEALATRARLSQGVVSRAANPTYGNLTLNTIIRIAAGFDVAFVGRFVPFSELDRWFTDLSEDSLRIKTFTEENKEEKTRGKSETDFQRLLAHTNTLGGTRSFPMASSGTFALLNAATQNSRTQAGSLLERLNESTPVPVRVGVGAAAPPSGRVFGSVKSPSGSERIING